MANAINTSSSPSSSTIIVEQFRQHWDRLLPLSTLTSTITSIALFCLKQPPFITLSCGAGALLFGSMWIYNNKITPNPRPNPEGIARVEQVALSQFSTKEIGIQATPADEETVSFMQKEQELSQAQEIIRQLQETVAKTQTEKAEAEQLQDCLQKMLAQREDEIGKLHDKLSAVGKKTQTCPEAEAALLAKQAELSNSIVEKEERLASLTTEIHNLEIDRTVLKRKVHFLGNTYKTMQAAVDIYKKTGKIPGKQDRLAINQQLDEHCKQNEELLAKKIPLLAGKENHPPRPASLR